MMDSLRVNELKRAETCSMKKLGDKGESIYNSSKETQFPNFFSSDKIKQLLQLGTMAVHASNDEDPLVTLKDEQDDDSETENHAILPTDNLIAVGHVEGEAAILEVYGMCLRACM